MEYWERQLPAYMEKKEEKEKAVAAAATLSSPE